MFHLFKHSKKKPTRSQIIAVCSGNICRSPMAEGLLKKHLQSENPVYDIISCGILNINGEPAAPYAVRACSEVNVDISKHRSKGILVTEFQPGDKVICMEPIHQKRVETLGIDLQIYPLWEYLTPQPPRIFDPVGGDLDTFRDCRDDIEGAILLWIERCLE